MDLMIRGGGYPDRWIDGEDDACERVRPVHKNPEREIWKRKKNSGKKNIQRIVNVNYTMYYLTTLAALEDIRMYPVS